MIDPDTTIWGLHAGATGEVDNLFSTQNRIAIGWPTMGNLADLAADRKAFKTRFAEKLPTQKPGAVPVNAGQRSLAQIHGYCGRRKYRRGRHPCDAKQTETDQFGN